MWSSLMRENEHIYKIYTFEFKWVCWKLTEVLFQSKIDIKVKLYVCTDR